MKMTKLHSLKVYSYLNELWFYIWLSFFFHNNNTLTFKVQSKIAADNTFIFFLLLSFEKK